jgi:hypothetical protein
MHQMNNAGLLILGTNAKNLMPPFKAVKCVDRVLKNPTQTPI